MELIKGQKVLSIDGKLYLTEQGDSLYESSNISLEEFNNEVMEMYHDYFPNSFIISRISKTLGTSIEIRFALGSGKEEYSNGYIENDPMNHLLMIHEITNDDLFEDKIEVACVTGGGLSIKSDNKYTHSQRIKVWRKISGTPEKIMNGLDNYFKKLYILVKENIDNMHEVPFDIYSKL